MRALILIVGILAVIAMVMPAYCVEKAEKTTAKGTVTEVDLELDSVTVVDEEGSEEVIVVGEIVKILKGGEEIKLADVVADDIVTVTKSGDVVETIEVEVIPVPPEKPEGVMKK